MLGKQLDELRMTGCLPSPTGVGLTVLELTRGEDYSLGDLAQAIQVDPALTSRIIKLANSSLRQGVEPARTVQDAAMRLGVRTVRSVALGFSLVNGNRAGKCPNFDYDAYWNRAIARAVVMQTMSTETHIAVPAEAFTLGLLCDIGHLALASIHPDAYSEILAQEQSGDTLRLRSLEREAFSVDHAELTGAMMRDWKLPESFAWAASSHGTEVDLESAPNRSARDFALLLRCAGLFSSPHFVTALDRGEPGNLETLREVFHRLQMPRESLPALMRRALAEWREWGRVLRVPTLVFPNLQAPLKALERSQPPKPTSPSTEPNAEAAQSPGAERKGLRILAVDDDPVALRLLVHHLVRDGHQVVQATNGAVALQCVLEQSPQMIITDWMMPELDGLEVCKALRRTIQGMGTYILVVAGREDENRIVEAFDAGADDYVSKPFNPRILLARVRAGQRMIELREKVELDQEERQRQMSRMAVLNRKFESQAMTDALTQLPNRRYAMDRLDQEFANSRRSQSSLSLIVIDIDHFKLVNDQFGHDVGDLVLRETAKVLKNSIRRADVVCRMGGEEFLVISPGSDLAGCEVTAERIRLAVSEHVIQYRFGRSVTVSLGVAELTPSIPSVNELLRIADRRVYSAKAAGRNRVCARSEDDPSDSAVA
jgi:diguanylate cyclase (GGDEF)-like protein